MTNALKLFDNRRTRLGLRNDTVDDLGLDSSPGNGNSSHRRHHHHHHNSHSNRQDHDAYNPNSRRINRHRLSEHETVQPEQNGIPFPSGSIINSEDFRSIRRFGATGNERLPGVVLLARERLLERLRGAHVSENRRTNRPFSSIHQDEFLFSGDNNVRVAEPVSESWQALITRNRNRPLGLLQDAINGLSMEVFKNGEESNGRECSICLEGFEDGDEVINLPCLHRFHSCCLIPWVEVCGACPNCRKAIVVN